MAYILKSLYETLIYRIFWLAYPVSLYFLYDIDLMLNFYLVSAIVFLSIIYFFLYYPISLGESERKDRSACAALIERILYCLIGYLVQVNLVLMDTYEINEGELNINYALSILKILMIIETLKRIYYYAVGLILFINLECHKDMDRSLYVMSFEIVYFYLWSNFYYNVHSHGFYLPIYYKFIGIIFCIIHGGLALFSYFLPVKICFGVLNLGYILGHFYSIYWRHRENY